MKIYTKTGDKGSTSLIGGKRVPKNHIRIEAYGTADELISFLALLRDSDIGVCHKDFILDIQEDLMVVSAILAADCDGCTQNLPKLSADRIVRLENEIDSMESNLSPLKSFIIPGGDQSISVCHITRTICRRLERVILTLRSEFFVDEDIITYINRLSDYLFTLARTVAADKKIKEIIWKPKLD